MQEEFEFRILEKNVHELFFDYEGKRLGALVRKIVLSPMDPRFERIGILQSEFRRRPRDFFFSSWLVSRRYSLQELAAAELFNPTFPSSSYFEPAGEECGTIYDDDPACRICGAGAKQVGPLFLDIQRIPKGKDIAKTVAGEIVVSQRLVDLFNGHGVTGAAFHPVRQKKTKDLRATGWYQFAVRPPEAEIIAPTRTGITPFDDDAAGEYRCPLGHTLGLNLLSEVSISAASRGEADVVATQQFIGRRAGVLRPEKVILVSPKVRRIIEENKLKGCRFEVAYLA